MKKYKIPNPKRKVSLKAIRASLASPRTPEPLKKGLRKYLARLRGGQNPYYQPGLMDQTDPRVIKGYPIKPGAKVKVTRGGRGQQKVDPMGKIVWIEDDEGNEQSVWKAALTSKPNPRAKKRNRSMFRHEPLKPPGHFNRSTMRTVTQGQHRVITGCPKGFTLSPDGKGCIKGSTRTGTEAQAILHPPAEPNPCRMRFNPKRKNPGAEWHGQQEKLWERSAKSPQTGKSPFPIDYYHGGAYAHKVSAQKSGQMGINPKGLTEIYGKVLRVEAQKGPRGNYPGEKFFHKFRGKTAAKAYGLPDGSVLIRSPKGKKLWGQIKQNPRRSRR